jgi:uncharacterized OsmC-like protein
MVDIVAQGPAQVQIDPVELALAAIMTCTASLRTVATIAAPVFHACISATAR